MSDFAVGMTLLLVTLLGYGGGLAYMCWPRHEKDDEK